MVEEKTTLSKKFKALLLKKSLPFMVPDDYHHDTQLDVFKKKMENLHSTYYFSEHLISKNFSKASYQLVLGKQYLANILPISKEVSSEECLLFLKQQKALLVGAQGLSILFEIHPQIFPKGTFVVSFDEPSALYMDAGQFVWVPYIEKDINGMFQCDLGFFDGMWDSEFYLLYITEQPV